MNIKLEAALYKKYPKIFRQRKLPMTETCMCWGISCGDGWYKIIDDLCADIQVFCDQNKCQIEATQVKEKFGTLRFYTGASCDSVEDMIEEACKLSAKTCEHCGSTAKDAKLRGKCWLSTSCKKCWDIKNQPNTEVKEYETKAKAIKRKK